MILKEPFVTEDQNKTSTVRTFLVFVLVALISDVSGFCSKYKESMGEY